jgi:hypothetical protein
MSDRSSQTQGSVERPCAASSPAVVGERGVPSDERVISHQLSQESSGPGNADTITPVCSCGWRGFGVAAYNDDQLARVKQQEFAHIRELQRSATSVSASHVPDGDGVLGTPNDQQEDGHG